MEQSRFGPRCRLLTALKARGPLSRTGPPLSSVLIEIRGEYLCISGTTPLKDNGTRYTHSGAEYEYILESAEAEKLLASLGSRPEQAIAERFEFTYPHRPLSDYLDRLGIKYTFHLTTGERL